MAKKLECRYGDSKVSYEQWERFRSNVMRLRDRFSLTQVTNLFKKEDRGWAHNALQHRSLVQHEDVKKSFELVKEHCPPKEESPVSTKRKPYPSEERVKTLVRKELEADLGTPNQLLKSKAEEVEPQIREIDGSTFYMRYVKAVKTEVSVDQAKNGNGPPEEDENWDEKVVEFCAEKIEEDEEISTSDLQEAAKHIHPSVAKLTTQQFQGRYRLRAHKRLMTDEERENMRQKMSKARKKAIKRGKSKEDEVENKPQNPVGRGSYREVRVLLVQYARDLAAALNSDDPVNLVEFLGETTDTTTDMILETARGGA